MKSAQYAAFSWQEAAGSNDDRTWIHHIFFLLAASCLLLAGVVPLRLGGWMTEGLLLPNGFSQSLLQGNGL